MKKERNERKMKVDMLRKHALLNIAAIALFIILLNLSISVHPAEGMKSRNTSLSFSWIGLASHAMVDDNPDFTSPVIVEKNKVIELEPGTYYWCVPFFHVCLKKTSFSIESEVSLVSKRIKEEEENVTYLVENTGNTAERIEVRNLLGSMITGMFILQPDASNVVKINETANIIAEQK